MVQVTFNNGKKQPRYYYWVSRKDIQSGEYRDQCADAFFNGNYVKVQEFNDCLIITTDIKLSPTIKELRLPKAKKQYTYSDILEMLKIYNEFH